MRRSLIPAVLAATLILAPAASAQILYGEPASGSTGLIHTHWKLETAGEEATLDQWVVPVSAFVPLKENLEARVYVAHASNTLSEPLTGDHKLSGLTDTRVQVSRSFGRDRHLVSAGLNLPTGKTGLDLQGEWLVMNVLTQNFLNLPVRRLGEGFGANLLLGTATVWKGRRVGVTASYNHSGAYEAYAGEGDYDPGDALQLTAGIQGDRGDWTWRGNASYVTHGDDTLEGAKVYSQGDQLGLHAGAALAREDLRANVDARYVLRGRNAVYDSTESLASRLKVYGNELALAGRVSWIRPSGLSYGPLAELRLIAGNEYGFGGTTLLGLGAAAGYPLREHLKLGAALRYFTGSTDDGNLDLRGYQVSLSVSGYL